MTPNWAASVVWVLVLAFFAVVGIGIGLSAYAASVLKKREVTVSETVDQS